MFLFLAIILFFFIHSVLKDLIISRVWNNSASSEVNNMGNQINKLEYLFSINGIKNFFLIFLGRIYYLSISSFLLIVYSIERLIQKLKQDYLNKRSNFISIFLLFSLLFALGISTISTLSSDFTDVSHMVYGRYIDNLFGPFILISLSEIELVKKNIHKLFSYTNLLIILGLSVSLLWEIYKPVWVSSINNAGISLFVSKDEIRVWPGIAVTLIGALIIYEITHLNINDNLKYGLVSIILVSFWFFNGTNAYHMFEDSNNISIQESSKRCAQVIRKLDDEYNGSISIYADRTEEISGKWEAFSGNGIQFLLNDKKVFYVNLEEEKAKLSKKDCIILLPVTHDIPNNFSLIESTEKYNLIIPIKSKLYKFIS